jgi:hypothetical protein
MLDSRFFTYNRYWGFNNPKFNIKSSAPPSVPNYGAASFSRASPRFGKNGIEYYLSPKDQSRAPNPFSDFERNWYIQNGFGDPTRVIKGTDPKQIKQGNSFQYVGVSPEARQLYLIATGGKEPLTINGVQNTPSQTLVTGSTGTGTQQTQLSTTNTVPSLMDPNQGRSGLRIRRSR